MEIEEILLDDKDFEAAIREAGLTKSLENFTSRTGDKRATGAVETYKKNLNKKDATDKERLEELEKELSELKAGKAKDSLTSQIKAELKKQNLSEGLSKYITIDDPEKIVESVENLKNDLLEAKQADIDSKLKGEGPPLKGDTSSGTSIPTAVKAYAEKISDIKK
ncbi:hypothetical protein ES707_16146 [subsurface metagenome]